MSETTCSSCHLDKPKDKYKSCQICRDIQKEYYRKYSEKNREKINERSRILASVRRQDPELMKKYTEASTRYIAKHREHYNELARKYRAIAKAKKEAEQQGTK